MALYSLCCAEVPLRNYSSHSLTCIHVFRGLNLDSKCESIQTEIEMLEGRADELQATVNQQRTESERLKKQLAKLKESESSITADVDELTQALHDDVSDFY